MNARVEAGPLTYHVVAIVSEPVIRTEIIVINSHQSVPSWTCLSLVPLTINGHSLNAINPDFKVGELATSILT
jgi:hypothetical protein